MANKTIADALLKAQQFEEDEKYEQAYECYKQALEATPNNTDILQSIAVCAQTLENYDDAKTYWNRLMELKPDDKEAILARMTQYNQARIEKQPLEYPSAGSTFKRPEGHFAGKLIMDAGLRGFSVGDAQVSEKHCGFVINKGNATAKDIRTLMEEVSARVKEQFGVELEPEVIWLEK